MENEHTNGTTPKGVQCSARKPGFLHCWHASNAPIQNPGVSVLFQSVCCFCAPEYMHLDVYMVANASDEEIVAEQMQHGHLITLKKMPKRGPSIAVPGR